MPRSRSMSILSRYCARICRGSTTSVICSIRSASVDLPWSMWAMMQKLRIRAGSVAPGWSVVGTLVLVGRGTGASIVPCRAGGSGAAGQPTLAEQRGQARQAPPDLGLVGPAFPGRLVVRLVVAVRRGQVRLRHQVEERDLVPPGRLAVGPARRVDQLLPAQPARVVDRSDVKDQRMLGERVRVAQGGFECPSAQPDQTRPEAVLIAVPRLDQRGGADQVRPVGPRADLVEGALEANDLVRIQPGQDLDQSGRYWIVLVGVLVGFHRFAGMGAGVRAE